MAKQMALLRSTFIVAAICATPIAGRTAEFQTGFDIFEAPKTEISSLSRVYVGQVFSDRFSLGQALYSASSGDAGGAFFWGGEFVGKLPFGPGKLSFGGFIGGGGGAAQISGNGLLLRVHTGYEFPLRRTLAVEAGASWISVSGAAINDPTLYIGLNTSSAPLSPAAPTKLRSASLSAQTISPGSSKTRSGGVQSELALVGGEVSFSTDTDWEPSLHAAGAARGGEGYMEVLGGLRRRAELGWGSAFAGAQMGFGGGGDVDTGGGLLFGAELGAGLRLSRALDVEAVVGWITAPNGDIKGGSAGLRMVRVFHRNDGEVSALPRIIVGTSLSQQLGSTGFMKSGATRNPLMYDSAIDMFVSPNTYLTVSAQTTVAGEVSGYAIGQIGVGHEIPFSNTWNAALEAYIGTAGGGGVDTSGGLIGGLRAELDYRLSQKTRLSMGLGGLSTLRGKGMESATMQIGLKFDAN